MWSIYSVIVVLWLIYYSPIGTTSLPDDNKEFLDLLGTLASPPPKPGFLPPDDDREILDLLGLLPSPTPKPDGTALIQAAAAGQDSAIITLLDSGANIEAKNIYDGTALIQAAAAGQDLAIITLLDSGADIEAKNIYGNTALYMAVAEDHPRAVQVLLDYGADIDSMDYNGNTPLHHAAWSGRSSTVEVLLNAGASPFKLNKQGTTPLVDAELRSKHNRDYDGTIQLLKAAMQQQNDEAQMIAPDDLENIPWNGKTCTTTCERKKAANGYEPDYKWCYTAGDIWSYCGCPNMWFEKQHVCEESKCNNENTFLAFMNEQRPPKSVDIYGRPYVATRNGAPVTTNTVFKIKDGNRISYKAYETPSKENACIMEKAFVAWECKFKDGKWSTCKKLPGLSKGFGYLSNGHYIGRTN